MSLLEQIILIFDLSKINFIKKILYFNAKIFCNENHNFYFISY